MRVFAKSKSDGYRQWVHLGLFKVGNFKPAVMHWAGIYPCCPVRFDYPA